ncbi:hypothetical protein [Streptomyces sp. NPDC054784]
MNGSVDPAVVQQGQWVTARNCKRVAVVMHTLTYAQRLHDVFSLFEGDRRVQLVFVVAPHAFSGSVLEYLRSLGIDVIPWEVALRSEFDLALAAGSRGIEKLRAPVVRLSHGAGQIKLLRQPEPGTGQEPGAEPTPGVAPAPPPRTAGMLSREHLMRDGHVVPAAVAFAHDDDVAELARHCPEALPVATVVGDSCRDRIVANLPRRAEFRHAMGLDDGQRLIVVPSTWGPSSSFGREEALLPRLLAELPPDRYRVAALLHPNVWSGHGGWQLRGWLADCLRRGLALIPPEADWQAPLIAADLTIGDHGSVTAYSVLAGRPVMLASYPHREVMDTSPAALLAVTAPALNPMRPLREQVEFAMSTYDPRLHEAARARLSSAPDQFARRMRALLYRLLELGEPSYPPPPPERLPLPGRLDSLGERCWGRPA